MLSPKVIRAVRKTVMQTSADIKAFSESSIIAEAFVYTPKILKTAAMR
jgi:hypothetical protein